MAKEKETKEKETKDKDPKEKVTKEKAAKPKKGDDKPVKKAVDEDLRHIVRILNTDLAGKKQVHMALTGIKGVGRRCAKLFTDRAGVDPFATLGLLPDSEIDKLKKVIEEDATKILPPWMVNRRGDIETGTDIHVMGMDLNMTLREDLDLMKKMRSYKGIRHERGLRVRGQRTRSSGRTGAIVGVSRKAVPATAPAATKE